MTNYIIIPLGINAHEYARELAEKTPSNFRKTYLASLATYATHRYLDYLDIPAKLESGRDLSLEIGRILCELIDPHTTTLSPIDTTSQNGIFARFVLQTTEDIAEVEDIYEVEILGFTENLAATTCLDNLSPLATFIDRLEEWELEKLTKRSFTKITELMNRLITLFPKLTLAQLTTWIDEAFPHPGSFVNSLQNKILGENLVPVQGFKNSPNDDNSGENELREILREILNEKEKETGGNDDDIDINDL